jgi:hypothetical protein
LCYKLIPIIYRTSLLQTSKVITHLEVCHCGRVTAVHAAVLGSILGRLGISNKNTYPWDYEG